MTDHRHCMPAWTAAVLALLLVPAAQAQVPSAGVYRCGNSYSSTPCPGGQAVATDDARTEAQRQQALAVKNQDAQLAKELAAERRAREKASAGQAAARIGPSAAERASTEAVAKKQAQQVAKKKRPNKPRKLGTA